MTQRNKFEWDDDNENHIAKHGVDRYEAMEAAEDMAVSIKRVGNDRYGNPRYVYVGKTEDGRILFMVVDRKARAAFVSGVRGTPSLKRRGAIEGGAKVKAHGSQAGCRPDKQPQGYPGQPQR